MEDEDLLLTEDQLSALDRWARFENNRRARAQRAGKPAARPGAPPGGWPYWPHEHRIRRIREMQAEVARLSDELDEAARNAADRSARRWRQRHGIAET